MKYVITGTSSGLGYILARNLTKNGFVIGISRSIGKAASLKKNGGFTHVPADLSKINNSKSLNKTLRKLKALINEDPFILILNAATFYAGEERIIDKRLSELLNVNVLSSMILVEELAHINLRRILVINSISGLIGQSQQHEYCTSKHALMGFTRSLIKSAKKSNYDVMCINPGGMQTELWADYESVETADFLKVETIADICESLISIPQRCFIENMPIIPPSDVQ